METADKTKVAQAVAALMEKHDAYSRSLGFELISVESGRAIVSVKITDNHLNGHGICHGGLTFSLADTAFAYACNSRNIKTVALNASISFTRAVQKGDTLRAVAQEQALQGKTGIYDITVLNQSEEIVALFRGSSYGLRTEVIDQPLI